MTRLFSCLEEIARKTFSPLAGTIYNHNFSGLKRKRNRTGEKCGLDHPIRDKCLRLEFAVKRKVNNLACTKEEYLGTDAMDDCLFGRRASNRSMTASKVSVPFTVNKDTMLQGGQRTATVPHQLRRSARLV